MIDKEKFLKEISDQIDNWNRQIEDMKIKAAGVKADLKKFDKNVEDMSAKKAELENKYSELRKSSGEAFDSIKKGVDDAVSDLQRSFKDAMSKFK